MTVDATPISHTYSYSGLGRYDFDFNIVIDEQVKVVHFAETTEAETDLQLFSNYTVVKNSGTSGGYIEVTAFEPTGGTIRLKRLVPAEQQRQWSAEGVLNLYNLELALDEIVMMIQGLESDIDLAFSDNLRFRGDWAANTLYRGLNIVQYDGKFYMAISDFTSTESFSASKWTLILDFSDLATAVANASQSATDAEAAKALAVAAQQAAAISEANSADNAQEAANCREDAYNEALSSASQASIATTKAATATAEADRAQSIADSLDLPDPATGSPGDVLMLDGAGTAYTLSDAIGWNKIDVSGPGSTTAQNRGFYFVDGSSGAYTLNFDTSPNDGDIVGVHDCTNSFDTNNCTIGRGGKKIAGYTDDLLLVEEGIAVVFKYHAATGDWRILYCTPVK